MRFEITSPNPRPATSDEVRSGIARHGGTVPTCFQLSVNIKKVNVILFKAGLEDEFSDNARLYFDILPDVADWLDDKIMGIPFVPTIVALTMKKRLEETPQEVEAERNEVLAGEASSPNHLIQCRCHYCRGL